MKEMNKNGFTLIEILIAITITGIVIAAMYQTFRTQQKNYLIQEDVSKMQQGLRAAMLFLANDIRMAGYNKHMSHAFGISDVTPRDINNNIDISLNGFSSIQLAADFDDDGNLDNDEIIQYSIFDYSGDGNTDLARTEDGKQELLVQNIKGFGLAFAFDNNGDGFLDTYTTNPGETQQIIWAIDSDAVNGLDTNLDTNLNGIIDLDDYTGAASNGIITGVALAASVPLDNIRAVRIWMLIESDRTETDLNSTQQFAIGKYVITPNNNRRLRLLTRTVNCRNQGLF